MWLTTLRGAVELREPFKSCIKTTFSPTKASSQSASDIYYTAVKAQELLKQCILLHLKVVRGTGWGRITGSNGHCLTLMKSPDEEADWSPSTDQPLPFPFSWVPRCVTGGISRLIADPCGLNLPLHMQYIYVCIYIYVSTVLVFLQYVNSDLFQIQWRVQPDLSHWLLWSWVSIHTPPMFGISNMCHIQKHNVLQMDFWL